VEAASLYHHVPNKDALLDGVLVFLTQLCYPIAPLFRFPPADLCSGFDRC
jgi:AcrR family transcriptional regulator